MWAGETRLRCVGQGSQVLEDCVKVREDILEVLEGSRVIKDGTDPKGQLAWIKV